MASVANTAPLTSSPEWPTTFRRSRRLWLLPLCYQNIPTQAHPARSRLLRFLVFLPRYILLGLLSLGNRASLNQRAVGSTPTRPTKPNFVRVVRLDIRANGYPPPVDPRFHIINLACACLRIRSHPGGYLVPPVTFSSSHARRIRLFDHQ